MSALFSSLSCCIWWFLAGVTLGWLLNRWLCKCCCKKPNVYTPQATTHTPPPSTTTAEPVGKLLETPAATALPSAATSTVVAPTAVNVETAVKPKAAPKPEATAKPKAVAVVKTDSFDAAAAKLAGFNIKKADDLTVIEGIGPKINTLFLDAGIQTFAQLAKATVPEMRTILDNAGPRYRIANPSTWAEQAALAADNKWAELKALQDALSAGIKK